VLLTTQYLDVADHLSDRIAVIDHGKVVAEGTSGQLKASIGSGVLHIRLLNPDQRAQAERVLSQVLAVPVYRESDPVALSARLSAGTVAHNVSEAGERVAQALAELSRSGVAVAAFAFGQPSLDEVFLALTGRPAHDEKDVNDPTTRQEAAS
jgi:ABC-2 type transport system ATP-binding protein